MGMFAKPLSRSLPSILLTAFLLVIYLNTMAPGLTWANDGSDGGDLITAAYTGGVPHPSGYPLYLLLARLFQAIPIGTLAWRTNLMSAMFAAFSALLVYHLVSRALNEQNLKHAGFAALLAGIVFGLTPLLWSQAVITEVYALQAFLTALILYLYIFPNPLSDFKRALILGLAAGNHLTTLLLLPLMFWDSSHSVPNRPLSLASSLTRKLAGFILGISLYLTLPLRAHAGAPVNWGNPQTLEGFWWLVSGSLYRSYYLQSPLPVAAERIQAWASLMIQQFGWLGIVLGVTGLIVWFQPSRLYLSTLWVGAAHTVFALVYSSNDSYLYLLPLCMVFSIWAGLAVGHALNMLQSQMLKAGMGILLTAFFLVQGLSHAEQVDASHDQRAERFGRQVLSEVPKDALVFVKGDRAVFTLWYFHFALDQRPDVAVVAEELLHFDWYVETLHAAYPALTIPSPLPWTQTLAAANPARPLCYVQYVERAEIECSAP
ncbi:MAG: DUF2723 domain-containing protein [Chloroflexota bacterium]